MSPRSFIDLMATRSSDERIYGQPSPFAELQLPTLGDVLRLCQWVKKEHKTANDLKREMDVRAMAEKVAGDVIAVYRKASVPTITFEDIVKKICNAWKLVRSQLETVQPSRRGKPFYTARLDTFKVRFGELFDVALDCDIASVEVPFLADQCGPRHMIIGEIDRDAALKVERSANRKVEQEAR